MKQETVKCIYCLKDNDIATQKSREHIFPKTYGGQRRLEKGVVCDECNNAFSVFEQDFARESILTFAKQFLHPKNKEQRKGKISYKLQVIETEKKEFLLGYIQEGETFCCPQIVFLDDNHFSFVWFDKFEKQVDLIKKTKIDKIKFIDHVKIEKGKPILAIYNQRVVGYYNDSEDKSKLIDLKKKITQHKQRFMDAYNPQSLIKTKSNLIVHQNFSFNMDSLQRALCKIALNVIAYYFDEFIYDSSLDEIREYVRGGKISYSPVHIMNNKIKQNKSFMLKHEKGNHTVAVGRLSPYYRNCISMLSFYDDLNVFAVILKDEVGIKPSISSSHRMLVVNYLKNDINCDYEVFEEVFKSSIKARKEHEFQMRKLLPSID